MNARRALLAAGVILGLAGCASTRIDDSLDEATRSAGERAGVQATVLRTDAQRRAAAEEVDRLLASPLTAENAVRVALINNSQLQLLLQQSAASMAAALQSGRLANPTFKYEWAVRGDVTEIGRLLTFQIIDLVTWPSRMKLADFRLEEDKLRAVRHVIDSAANARNAWVDAVAAGQTVNYQRDVLTAAEASAELARRMQGVGNFSKLQRAREQAFYADAVVQMARAQNTALSARERLVRALGLSADQAGRLKLPERLPDIPGRPRNEADVASFAMDQRLDVQAAQAALDTTAQLSGVTNVRSVVSRLEFGPLRISETNEPTWRGYEVEVPIPVFDIGDAVRAEMSATYAAAVLRTRQVIVDAQSEVRESFHAYRTSYDVARHYRDEIVPLRKAIAEENLYRYNGMLIGVFELLADAREQVSSVVAAIEAQREFWLADAALTNTLIGRSEALPRTLGPVFRAAAGGADPH